jgi:pantoate--beta-alanine ligase
VATVVAKLFHLTQPDTAYFGQKDAQQVVVIRRMVRDLDFPLDVAVCPTVREANGLAMSSRNAYLTPVERAQAGTLYMALREVSNAYERGERDPDVLKLVGRAVLEAADGFSVDYVSIADPHTLREQDTPTNDPLLVSLAAKFGQTRLLDNCLLPSRLNDRAGLTATLGA